MEGKKVYFVAIGDFPDNVMQDFVSFYKQKFNLDVQVLKTITPDPRLFDGARQQLAAEPLVDSVHAAFPEVANDPGAVLIGLTTSDIYPTSVSWQFAFGWRKGDLHTAVVSAARMGIHYAGEPDEVAKPEVRMRKMISKDIGMLYYGLAQSNNPRSVLYNQIGGIEELDAVGEDF
jgi:predicted Zn-dependent protease